MTAQTQVRSVDFPESEQDAANTSLSLEGRFDLAYNAAHSLSLAALRWHGYRASNRYIVFQVLPHTHGESKPVALNMHADKRDNPEGRAKNR